MNAKWKVPLIIRGEIFEDHWMEFGGRRGDTSFLAPDVTHYLDKLVLDRPSRMADLYQISFDDIVEYLGAFSQRLDMATNRHLQEAYELSRLTSGLSDSILRHQYEAMHQFFLPEVVRESAENFIGIDFLENWVELPSKVNPALSVKVRAFGARAAHIIAGNAPGVAAMTVLRNAFTRSDAIIKTPSNDPITAAALARTMIEMAPDHPLTRHLSVAYWKGGNEQVETLLYHPKRIEKIVAWGGFASISHITRYLQPGIDLVTLDPKHSATIIDADAFADEDTLQHVARRLALDMGALNQEGCVCARVVYVVSGTDEAGLARLNRLGALTFQALQQLPPHLSTPHKAFDANLKAELDALRFAADEYHLYGGSRNEGAVIVSQSDAPVDFSRMLSGRVCNLVPIDDLEAAVLSVNSYTQTIGLFPEALKTKLRDRLAYQGAQRLVSLGGAATMFATAAPQDGIEPVRRMCKWIVDESASGELLENLALTGIGAQVGH